MIRPRPSMLKCWARPEYRQRQAAGQLRRRADVLGRFMAKVEPEPMSGCWLWIGSRLQQGYGLIKIDRKITLAHRVAWTIFHGPIPEGLCVLHRCDNPPCVNPAHLWLGTQADNTADRHAKGRTNVEFGGLAAVRRAVTECPQGHPYSGDNLALRDGKRCCRACGRADSRRRYHLRRRTEAV